MSGKMWSGRFGGNIDEEFGRWQRSFDFDQRLLAQELQASRAYARALALPTPGILSATELAAILNALGQIESTTTLPVDDKESEDIHHFVERRLIALIGDTGRKLHSGRSRNEQIATDLRLYLREHGAETLHALLALCNALLTQAEAAQRVGAVMPSYTHLQRAEPVFVAHWLLAYIAMFLRDAERLQDAVRRMNECPLGSGPVAGSTLPLDREFLARELGFDRSCGNSIDATADRDFLLEYVNALAIITIHLSRLSEEMCLFASQEYGFVLLPDAFSTGSSAMPQKKNPDAFELMRGKSARVLGCAQGIAIAQKGLALAYNKDLQELQPMLFEACDTTLGSLRVATGAMAALEFDFARMKSAATCGYMNAMAAATYLAGKGVPFRRAHEEIGAAVRYALARGCELEGLSLPELQQFAPQAGDDFFPAITLEAVLDGHDVIGGTARHRVEQALVQTRKRLNEEGKVQLARA